MVEDWRRTYIPTTLEIYDTDTDTIVSSKKFQKKRQCLKCLTWFMSNWKGNRSCKRCVDNNNRKDRTYEKGVSDE